MVNIYNHEKLMIIKGVIRVEREGRNAISDIETKCLRMGKLTYCMFYYRVRLVKYKIST